MCARFCIEKQQIGCAIGIVKRSLSRMSIFLDSGRNEERIDFVNDDFFPSDFPICRIDPILAYGTLHDR